MQLREDPVAWMVKQRVDVEERVLVHTDQFVSMPDPCTDSRLTFAHQRKGTDGMTRLGNFFDAPHSLAITALRYVVLSRVIGTLAREAILVRPHAVAT